jgi:hypothetical protein
VACNIAPQQLVPVHQRGGCYRFVVPAPGGIITHAALSYVRAIEGVLEATMWAADGSRAPEVRTGRDRSGAIVTGAESREAAVELANRVAAMLESADDTRDSEHQSGAFASRNVLAVP